MPVSVLGLVIAAGLGVGALLILAALYPNRGFYGILAVSVHLLWPLFPLALLHKSGVQVEQIVDTALRNLAAFLPAGA